MGSADYLKWGTWNVICDRCGVKRKADQVRKEWTGLIVCKDKCWEARHPQDFVRAVNDDQSVAFVRSEPADQFVSVTYDCAAEEDILYPVSQLMASPIITINKGHTPGPYTAFDGQTITVRCTWSII